MTALDLALVGGHIVTADGIFEGSVGVRDGKIVTIVGPGEALTAQKVVNVGGQHILPGVIDPHVHMRLSGAGFGEICERETRSLIAGGVTTGIVFTEAPRMSYSDILEERITNINAQSYCDIGLHPMIQSFEHAAEIGEIARRFGVSSFKMYFAGGGRELYPDTFAVDDGVMYAAFGEIAKLGGAAVAMVHAENWEVAAYLQRVLQAEGRNDPAAWTDSKPDFVEEECIRRAAFYAKRQNCALYVVHVSSGAGASAIAELRGLGQRISGETCPHYLTVHRLSPEATMAKYNPAIKTAEDNDLLWDAIATGALECMGSDHIPIRWADKEVAGFDDIWKARGGVPGSATILPLLLSEGYNQGRLTLPQIVALTSTNAAKRFGLDHCKGSIAPGMDADFVVVDLDRSLTFDPALLQVDYSIYTGREWKGWPSLTVVRGEIVMQEGSITGAPGYGNYLRRQPVEQS